MEMWLTQSSLVLLAVAVGAVVVSGQEYVILVGEKSKEEVAFGSSLVLRCFLNTTISESFWVRWHFNASGSSFSDYSNISQKSFDNKTTKEILRDEHGNILAEHVIPNVTLENSGWYICKVTARIPLYHEYISNGTQVVIKKSVDNTTYRNKQAIPPQDHQTVDQWMWILLGVSVFTLIVLLLTYFWLRRRCRGSRDDPIYANTRPVAGKQPSPRPGMPVDKLKTVPSSQNFKRYEEGKRRHKP
ncbi:uncharacterized protein LOC108879050 isoform X2 [Lates calcarifer]|uniref:Uncharacterized protein LOC108879050 isoform X2 n=1 Tax=Lates calcarifer TaxID=8187 RepID=A0AAJ7LKD3_LATCA|nr:uncharacterized protein LOC108879050 isoform X2 [Lates calcarifer]